MLRTWTAARPARALRCGEWARGERRHGRAASPLHAGHKWTTQGKDDWTDHLETLKHLFIGETPGADSVTIQNPEALAFNANWWGKLEADAAAPLVFENRALDYRLRYHLRAFEGSHQRSLLEPEDDGPVTVAPWRNRRAVRGHALRLLRLRAPGRAPSERLPPVTGAAPPYPAASKASRKCSTCGSRPGSISTLTTSKRTRAFSSPRSYR